MKSTIHEYQKNNFKIVSKNIILGMLLLVVTLSTQAQVKKNKNAKYSIEVNGNCEQCQKRIQKAAFSVNGVKTASWSIETHQLDLTINEEKTSIATVEKSIAKVGHDTKGVKANKEDYDNLHHCCKYDRLDTKD
jgi:copper chaperone CopZ